MKTITCGMLMLVLFQFVTIAFAAENKTPPKQNTKDESLDDYYDWRDKASGVIFRSGKLVGWDHKSDGPILHAKNSLENTTIPMSKLGKKSQERALALKAKAQKRGIVATEEQIQTQRAAEQELAKENEDVTTDVVRWIGSQQQRSQLKYTLALLTMAEATKTYVDNRANLPNIKITGSDFATIEELLRNTRLGQQKRLVDGKVVTLEDLWNETVKSLVKTTK